MSSTLVVCLLSRHGDIWDQIATASSPSQQITFLTVTTSHLDCTLRKFPSYPSIFLIIIGD